MTLRPTIGCSEKGVGMTDCPPLCQAPSLLHSGPQLCRPNIPGLDLLTPKPTGHQEATCTPGTSGEEGCVVVTCDGPPGGRDQVTGGRRCGAGWLGQPEIQAHLLLAFLTSSPLSQPPWHSHVPTLPDPPNLQGQPLQGWHLAMETATGLSPAQWVSSWLRASLRGKASMGSSEGWDGWGGLGRAP